MTNHDLRSPVWGRRGGRSSDVDFRTAPYTGTGREGDQSVVHLDRAADADPWLAGNSARVPDRVAAHPGARPPAAPR